LAEQFTPNSVGFESQDENIASNAKCHVADVWRHTDAWRNWTAVRPSLTYCACAMQVRARSANVNKQIA